MINEVPFVSEQGVANDENSSFGGQNQVQSVIRRWIGIDFGDVSVFKLLKAVHTLFHKIVYLDFRALHFQAMIDKNYIIYKKYK